MKKKICRIINGPFSWILEVDDQEISLNGGSAADYFEKHYKKLGYKVERYKAIMGPDSFDQAYLVKL